jgi:hypothetical protein
MPEKKQTKPTYAGFVYKLLIFSLEEDQKLNSPLKDRVISLEIRYYDFHIKKRNKLLL